jgi:hypothetical protein
MLSRPAYSPPHAPERVQTTALASLAGMFIGVVAVVAVLWINSLTQAIRDQNEKLAELARGQRVAFHAMSTKVEPGSGDGIVARYEKAVAEYESQKELADVLRAANEKLEKENYKLGNDVSDAKKKKEAAESLLAAAQAAAREAATLRSDLAKAQSQIATQTSTIHDKSELLDAVDTSKATDVVLRARWGVWFAIVGWGVAAILGVCLVVGWSMFGPKPPLDAPAPPMPPPANPHVIE